MHTFKLHIFIIKTFGKDLRQRLLEISLVRLLLLLYLYAGCCLVAITNFRPLYPPAFILNAGNLHRTERFILHIPLPFNFYCSFIARLVSTESKYPLPGPGIELTITISLNSRIALIYYCPVERFCVENLEP